MKEYLPVGSVVLLNKGTKPVVIIGYKVSSQDKKIVKDNLELETDKVFDYCALLYPEGILSSEMMLMFNQEDIKEVLFKGYETEESKRLSDYINQNSK